MKDRGYRRAQVERIKERRKHYWGFLPQHRGSMDERQLGIVAQTPKPCDCWMCKNPRPYQGPTIQELRHME